MIKITEHKSYSGNYYTIDTLEKNKILSSQTIKLKSCILFDKYTSNNYYMLYDINMNPITEVFNYINFYMASTSPNTKEKSLHALKLLYAYLTIFNLSIRDLNRTDIKNLQYFLKGISPKGYDISLYLQSTRKNETINGYLNVYRGYIKFLNIKKSPLLVKIAKPKIITNSIGETKFSVYSYESNLRLTNKNLATPKYISVSEFKRIIDVVRIYYGKREECIIRLMFEGGLRIGEVLGLTADDILTEEIDGNITGVIYIRNRYSDKSYQKAKTCININSTQTYTTEEYNTPGDGYQTVVVDIELIDIINEYIEEFHILARENMNKNYYKYTLADRVRPSEPYEDDNYYVFLNSLGRPLSYQSWKNIIKDIFKKSGLPVDSIKRKNNLSHRFRHGFAMFLVNYLDYKPFELMKRMRHTSLSSTCKYYNLTVSDIVNKKNKLSVSLYNIIPELKI